MKKYRYFYNFKLKNHARKLRRNLTPAEKKLWQVLRKRQFLGIKFHRQIPIGSYIVDFCSFSPKIIIEIDGDTHYFSQNRIKDSKRDHYFKTLGFLVFRFTNREILENLEGVLKYLHTHITSSSNSS